MSHPATVIVRAVDQLDEPDMRTGLLVVAGEAAVLLFSRMVHRDDRAGVRRVGQPIVEIGHVDSFGQRVEVVR